MSRALTPGRPRFADRILQINHRSRKGSRYPAMAMLFLVAIHLGGAPREETRAPQDDRAASLQTTTTAVEVDVIVQSSRGDYVRGLEASDFKLYENDVRQKITLFVPPGEGGRGSAQRGTSTSRETAVDVGSGTAQDDQRERREAQFVTIVIDLADTQQSNLAAVIRATADYVKNTLSSEDFVSVFWIGGSLHLLIPVTEDKDEAVRAVESLAGKAASGFETSAERSSTRQEIERVQGTLVRVRNPARVARLQQEAAILEADLAAQDTLQARAVFVALRALAEQYRTLPGRKCVILFSDDFSPAPEIENELSAVIDAANRSDVSFYVIGGAGSAPPSTNETLARVTPTDALSSSRYKPHGDPGGLDEFDRIRMGAGAGASYLTRMAEDTGGLMVGNPSDLLLTLAEVNRDRREYYTLVYQPSDTNYNGAFRKIGVEVLRPRCRLRYRQGYWGIPFREETMLTPAAQQLLASAAAGSTKSDPSVAMNAALLFDSEGHPSLPVTIQFPTKNLSFARQRDHYVAGITLVVAARDAGGKLVGVHQRFANLNLTEEEWKEFLRRPTVLEAHIRVPRLQSLNLQTVIQFSGRKAAVVEDWVTAPAVESGPQLTSLLLTNRVSRVSGPPDSEDPLRIADYQISLPPRPVFSPNDRIMMLIGALDLPFDPVSHAPEFDVSLAVRSGNKIVISGPPDQVQYSGAGGTGRALLAKQVSLKGLGVGSYVAESVVTDRLRHSTSTQTTRFEIQ